MKIISDFNNISTKLPGRSNCFYQHKLQIEYAPGETQISVAVEGLPPGLEFNADTMSIIGTIQDFNLWHPCKDYVAKEIMAMADDFTPFPDCYESLDNLIPLTAGFLKTLKTVHYSGKNYGKFGDLAYVEDGNKITQELTITVVYNYTPTAYSTSSSGLANPNTPTPPQPTGKPGINTDEVKITMNLEVTRSPKKFILDYGRNNELIGEDKQPCTPEEYIAYLVKLGQAPLDGCS